MNTLIHQALKFHQDGDLKSAEKIYEVCVKNDPKNIDLLMLYGMLAGQLNRPELVVILMKRVLKINQKNDQAYFNLGVAYQQMGQCEFALKNFNLALHANNQNQNAYLAKAETLSLMDKDYEAIEIYLNKIQDFPNNSDLHNSLGLVYKKLGMMERAEHTLNKAINLNSSNFEYFYNLGNLYSENNKLHKAIECYSRALSLDENNYEVLNNLGNVYRNIKSFDLALPCYQKSIELNSSCPDSYFNLGVLHMDLGVYSKAIIAFERALELNSNFPFLMGVLQYAKMRISDWKNFDRELKILIDKVMANELVSSPFPLLALTDSLEVHRKVTLNWAAHNKYCITGEYSKSNRHLIGRKIKIGYFSSDLYSHPVNFLAIELFEKHNREKFEIIGFSFTPYINDPMYKRASQAFDAFIDVCDMSNIEVAEIARNQALDIAVDLGGYTTDSRASVFASRIAPIQIGYLGYPGMLGGLTDYILADEIIIPRNNQNLYTEKVAYIPNYLVNSQRRVSDRAYTKDDLGLPNQGFIFCCFNNNHKILPTTFHGWMRILLAVEESVLWLGGIAKESRENLLREANSKGIASNRIIFAERMEYREDHLARLKVADLFLDTFPYGAHTSGGDALWVGLPLLTLAGQSFASRVGASMLTAIEMPELIANTQADFESRAIHFAKNPEYFSAIRKKLSANCFTTNLFNVDKFVKNIETTYVELYKNWALQD